MAPSPEKPLAFTRDEIDRLTSQWSDIEIARSHGIAYSAVRKARLFYGFKTFTQRTGLIRIASTGELRSKGSVRGVVRSDSLDDQYFAQIDNPEKAYWLGMLFADGWITSRNGIPKEVGLACQIDDAEIIEAFKTATGYSGRVVRKENKKSLSSSGSSTLAVVRITCQAFTANAMAAGLQHRKSGKLTMPNAAYLYPADFCRGFFDGDGSLCDRNFTFICGSSGFQRELQALIAAGTGHLLFPASPLSPTTGKPVERLTGYRKDKEVLDWIYQRTSPSLSRKLAKYQMYWN